MIFAWIIIIWVVAALLYGVFSIKRQARRGTSAPSILAAPPKTGEESKESPEHAESPPQDVDDEA
ncbi:MAG TPA: hypothetical protein VLU25_12335 [Acidobacteriota bacterium]|nr:hypothetical protein [Acidobacteriota bacterium]